MVQKISNKSNFKPKKNEVKSMIYNNNQNTKLPRILQNLNFRKQLRMRILISLRPLIKILNR